MADRYIDLDEIEIYGPHAVKMIQRHVLKQLPEFEAGMNLLCEQVTQATTSMGDQLRHSRKASAGVRLGRKAKDPVLGEALEVLGNFGKHLSSHPEAVIDRKSYFTEKGTVKGMGRSAPNTLLALRRIANLLGEEGCPIREAAYWKAECERMAQALAPVIDHSRLAHADRRFSTPELEQARAAWLSVYTATKCGVECVLRLTGQLHLMPVIFHDLAVPGTAKVTEAPPETVVEALPPVAEDGEEQ